MKLSEWAKENNYSYRYAWQLFKDGKIPYAEQMPTGTILIRKPPTTKPLKVAV